MLHSMLTHSQEMPKSTKVSYLFPLHTVYPHVAFEDNGLKVNSGVRPEPTAVTVAWQQLSQHRINNSEMHTSWSSVSRTVRPREREASSPT